MVSANLFYGDSIIILIYTTASTLTALSNQIIYRLIVACTRVTAGMLVDHRGRGSKNAVVIER